MKFVSSFSTGKDSVLALHRMINAGHEPLALLVMFNKETGRSWFHGADEGLLKRLADSLDIPLVCCRADGDEYISAMENALRKLKAQGAESCVFGDIDIEAHRGWNEQRCRTAGLTAVMPLWGENREKLVREVIGEGYKCMIKAVRANELPESLLGKILDEQVIEEIRSCGADPCGENGEYHTVTLDGPLFRYPISHSTGRLVRLEHVSVIELFASDEQTVQESNARK